MGHFAKCGYHDFALGGNLKVTTVETPGASGNMPTCGGGIRAQENTQSASFIQPSVEFSKYRGTDWKGLCRMKNIIPCHSQLYLLLWRK